MAATKYSRITMLTACLALAVTLAPSSARATDGGKGPSNFEEFFKMHAMPAMHMMDKDNKGYVTKEEFTKFMEELFDRMDKDHSGKVSVEEWLGHKPGKSQGMMKQGEK